MDFEISESVVTAASPEAVFDLITDIERLPEWNKEIGEIHENPAALTPGAQWVVEIHAMGTHWPSRSTVVECDREAGIFAYRTQSDDGNPSFVNWVWRLTPHAGGCRIQVDASVNPRSFWRRYLLSNIRRPNLRHAVRTSLNNLTNERSFA
jgi:uncharacterized protein YndB with AHSA1/START domain